MMAAVAETFKYRAFISYSHADRRWGDWLHAALETYRVPKKLVGTVQREGQVPAKLFPIFRDREELPTSSDLGGNIRVALEQSRFLIVICSPRSAKSRWVEEEILTFKRLGRESRILTLLIDGTPGSGDADECFSRPLRFALGADGELSDVRVEPIAADARPGGDGRHYSKLKLLAGLLGVDFDALRQRERERRRRRRLQVALAAVCLGAAIMGILQAERRDADRKQAALVAHQVAEDAEERGRRELLAGDAQAAAGSLRTALAAEPDRAAALLMLGVAHRRCAGLEAVIDHEGADVQSLMLSPAGRHLLITDSEDRSAALWDFKTRRLVRKLALGGEALGPFPFSGSGDKLLRPGDKGWVVHDIATGSETELAIGFGSRPCFLGDGSKLLWLQSSGGEGPAVLKVLEAGTGRELRQFALQTGTYGEIEADASGRTCLIGWFNEAGEPRLTWLKMDAGEVIADLNRHGDGQMDLSRDGERILYRRTDGAFDARSEAGVLWSTKDGGSLDAEGHWSRGGKYALITALGETSVLDAGSGEERWRGYFTSSATDDADSIVGYADNDGQAHVRELGTGRRLAQYADQIGWPDRSEFPSDRLALFSRDGRFLILGGSGKRVKIWDWQQTRTEPLVLGERNGKAKPHAVRFSPEGTLLANLRDDGAIMIWEVGTWRERTILTPDEEGGAWTFDFKADGNQILAGSRQPRKLVTASVWNSATAERLMELDDGAKAISAEGRIETRSPMLEQHIRVAWVGDRMVTVNFNLGMGCLWDGATGRRLADFRAGPNTMELSTGGEAGPRLVQAAKASRFVVAGFDGVARVFDAKDGRVIASLTHPFPDLVTAALSADGTVALTRDLKGRLAAWDVAAARPLATPGAEPAAIQEAHLTADGRQIVAGCSDHCVRLWEVESGQWTRTFRNQKPPGEGRDTLGAPFDSTAPAGTYVPEGFVTVQADPKGLWLAAVHMDGHLCVWEKSSERQLLRWKLDSLSRHARLVASPNGDWLALTGIDGAVRLFNLSPQAGPVEGGAEAQRNRQTE